MRYLLDEHIAPVYRGQLLRIVPELEVWIVGDRGAPPRGTLDPDILIWCEEHRFVLVTNNRKSMPRQLADHLALGRHIPGISSSTRRCLPRDRRRCLPNTFAGRAAAQSGGNL